MFCKDETGVAEVLIAARADLTAQTRCDYAAAARARAIVRSPHVALQWWACSPGICHETQ